MKRSSLYGRLRTRQVLHRAWTAVRQSGRSSESDRTREQLCQFEASWLANLETIRSRLQKKTFDFSGEQGITPRKRKGNKDVRPIVLAPIANRVVRRAILEILQGYGDESTPPRYRWIGVRAVREVLETRTSVGGIRRRGVPTGLTLVSRAVQRGSPFFIRSDIRNFFTRIPKGPVNKFIRTAVCDDDFASLFEKALDTNLENWEALEERNTFKLFPDPEVGVAQGSALSALAGNITLREFDERMNGRDITCVRYIDDFILLGPSETKVRAAYKSARQLLDTLGMSVYDPSDSTARKDGKVDCGNIFHGTDFLGYRISGKSLQPSEAAKRRFLDKLDSVVARAETAMELRCKGEPTKEVTYYAAMVELDKIVWGWSQAFRHTNARHVWSAIDNEVEKRIRRLNSFANRPSFQSDHLMRRRILGVRLLSDLAVEPLPDALIDGQEFV